MKLWGTLKMINTTDRKSELEKLSKDQLVNKVLESEATAQKTLREVQCTFFKFNDMKRAYTQADQSETNLEKLENINEFYRLRDSVELNLRGVQSSVKSLADVPKPKNYIGMRQK